MLTATTRAGAPRPATFQAPAQKTSAIPDTPRADNPAAPLRAGDLKDGLYNALRALKAEYSADAVLRANVSLQGSDVVIHAPKAMLMALKEPDVQKAASRVLGNAVKVRVEADENLAAPAEPVVKPDTNNEDEVRQRALSHPGVKRFQELFPGAQVRAVRNLNE